MQTYFFRPSHCSSPHSGRNAGDRMVVAQSNCSRMRIEERCNCSRIVVVTTNFRFHFDSTRFDFHSSAILPRYEYDRLTTYDKNEMFPFQQSSNGRQIGEGRKNSGGPRGLAPREGPVDDAL